MRASRFGLVFCALSLGTACGGHTPAAPSTVQTEPIQTTVSSAVADGMNQVAVRAPTTGDVVNTFTMPCPGGGSIVLTFGGTLPRDPGTVLTTSSRSEHRDCKYGNTTINGDPYLESTNEHIFSGPGATGTSTSTMRATGGLRFDADGVQGRVKFNCTMIVTIPPPDGASRPLPSMTWSGTTTWEQPIGSTSVVRPCGPA